MSTTEINPGSIYKSRSGVHARVKSTNDSYVTVQTRQGSPGRFKSTPETIELAKFQKGFKLVEGAKPTSKTKLAAQTD